MKKRHQSGTPEDLAFEPSQAGQQSPTTQPTEPQLIQSTQLSQSQPSQGQALKDTSEVESFLTADSPANAKVSKIFNTV